MDSSIEAFCLDSWEVTAVVEMCVREHGSFDIFNRISGMAIAAVSVFPRSLKQAAFHEKLAASNLKEVL
jgi:hypothetical protein